MPVYFGFYLGYIYSMSQLIPLEDRCIVFAKAIVELITNVPKTPANNEYVKQIIRSSASVGANYVEAGESLSRKDFIHRIRIARKEAKETHYWLQLIATDRRQFSQHTQLLQESMELMRIFSAIASKVALKDSVRHPTP